MKKLVLLTALFAMCCGCDKEPEITEDIPETLAGSVATYSYYSMEGGWSFDGVPLELSKDNNYIKIQSGISGTSISMTCAVNTGNTRIEYMITLDTIPLVGVPGDVTFARDYLSLTFSKWFSETARLQYSPVLASIKGWIKVDRPATRTSWYPSYWPYDCDIEIECEVDGKPLKLHITRMAYIIRSNPA